MSVPKIVALSVVAWVALGGVTRADAIDSSSGWKVWLIGNSRVVQGDPSFAPNLSGGDTLNFSSSSSSPFVGSNGTTAPVAPPVAASAAPAFTPSAPTASNNAPASGSPVTAFLNFGTASYPELSALTTGNAQPWYESPTVQKVFGGIPTLSQQTSFENQVLNDVQSTFSHSGVTGVNFTLDPNSSAAHTLSVVSGIDYAPLPGAIGITDVGHNGFSFIDNFTYASAGQIDQLAWALAHNISHELMHAFGVAVHHDQTGTYLDAGTAQWSLLTSPSTVFSPAAVSDIQAHLNGTAPASSGASGQQIDGDEMLAQPVPEPATLALWGLGGGIVLYLRRRRQAA